MTLKLSIQVTRMSKTSQRRVKNDLLKNMASSTSWGSPSPHTSFILCYSNNHTWELPQSSTDFDIWETPVLDDTQVCVLFQAEIRVQNQEQEY